MLLTSWETYTLAAKDTVSGLVVYKTNNSRALLTLS